MRKFGSSNEKEETWQFSPQGNLNILQQILLHCQLSPSCSIGGQFLAFSADRHTRQY